MNEESATPIEESVRFEEGKPCPVKIEGHGGGLSFSPAGDMLLLAAIPNPSPQQIQSWGGKWRAKLVSESEFPSIPIFGIDGEDWILEAPCNPSAQEQEAPGFMEALYAKDDPTMVAVLVDSESGLVVKIHAVPLDEMFIERLVLSWNPFRHGDQYNKSFDQGEFANRIQEIFKMKSSKQLWTTSW